MADQLCATLVPGERLCGDPADHIVTTGCVHEHIDRDAICDWHWQLMRKGDLRCPYCWRGSDPHDCPVIGRLVA